MPYLPPDWYPSPWTPDHPGEPVDHMILATWRADQLAAHLATRLEDVGNALEDEGAASPAELHALSLCAVQIRQLLADVTRLAGAYV